MTDIKSMATLYDAHRALLRGEISSVSLVNRALDRVEDPGGEGCRTFLRVYRAAAMQAARAADTARAQGGEVSPLAGLPVSVKDLFDVAGEMTLAGSKVRANAAPAAADSAVVKRLRKAGAVIVGRTNMTEFAYSGLGLNPHYGTPANPFERSAVRIPGGSSSGGAVSVSDGMAFAAVVSDTGGSARIPAAFCGLTGFKPTAARIPLGGAFPLSPSLDSVGVIGATVACCAALDSVLAGQPWLVQEPVEAKTLRIGIVVDFMTQDLDPQVTRAYHAALSSISAAGVHVEEVRYPELFDLPAYNRNGGFAAYESYRAHAELIEVRGDEYDPRVAARIRRGKLMQPHEHALLCSQRDTFMRASAARFRGFHALVAPTVPIIAPLLGACDLDEEFARLNLLALRNPSVVNFLDGCAISIPCHRPGDAPVGLMLFQTAHRDQELLAVALAIEELLRCRQGVSHV